MSMTALALRNGWKKHAFVQAGPGGQIPPPNPAGGAGGAPMDPAMGGMAGAMPPGMAAGGGAMPPPGGMPPGGMPPGGAPPMDRLKLRPMDIGELLDTTCRLYRRRLTTCLDELRQVMRHERIRHVPVVNAGRVEGMISIGDLNYARSETMVETIRALEAYITSA